MCLISILLRQTDTHLINVHREIIGSYHLISFSFCETGGRRQALCDSFSGSTNVLWINYFAKRQVVSRVSSIEICFFFQFTLYSIHQNMIKITNFSCFSMIKIQIRWSNAMFSLIWLKVRDKLMKYYWQAFNMKVNWNVHIKKIKRRWQGKNFML